jgi:hypothetical protein
MRAAEVLRLQHTVGNQTVGRLLARSRPTTPGNTAAGVPTIQRVLSHANQGTVGFGRRLGHGNRVDAAWIRNDGTLNGTGPQGNPPGYDYIRQLKLTNFWIRFHVVNKLAGGPGTIDNLIPASKRDNSLYEKRVEKDVKDSVDNVKSNGGQIFFGAEVQYQAVGGVTTAQQNAAPFFPTSITYYHEELGPGATTWTWTSNAKTFIFTNAQPIDHGNAINLSAVTADQLRTQVYNRDWAGDVAFIQSLAAGATKTTFENLIDHYLGIEPEKPEEGTVTAVDMMPYGTSTFGERIGKKEAVIALGTAIAQGFLRIA